MKHKMKIKLDENQIAFTFNSNGHRTSSAAYELYKGLSEKLIEIENQWDYKNERTST